MIIAKYLIDSLFLSILIIHPISSPWIAKIHCAFGAGKLAASALKASFIIMHDFSFFKSKPLCRTESEAWFIYALPANTGLYFYMLFFINLKAYEAKLIFNAYIHDTTQS